MSQPAEKSMREILTPKSRRWKAFTEALELAVQINGCDADATFRANPTAFSKYTVEFVKELKQKADIPFNDSINF
jgi:hypothetical protein